MPGETVGKGVGAIPKSSETKNKDDDIFNAGECLHTILTHFCHALVPGETAGNGLGAAVARPLALHPRRRRHGVPRQ